ncbi:MAG: hypothetical protein AAF411_13235 [Myxococcota bacterium]
MNSAGSNKNARGLQSCDPTHGGAPVGPAAMPEPAESLAWGSMPPPAAEDEIALDAEDLLDADAALEPGLPNGALPIDPPTFGAAQAEQEELPTGPREFLPVDAPMLELDLPEGESARQSARPPGPERALNEGGSDVPETYAEVVDDTRFWSRLPLAFIAPFTGQGWLLLLVAALAPLAMGAIFAIPVNMPPFGFLLRVPTAIVAAIFFIGLLSETFARNAQAGADNSEGMPRVRLADTSAYTLVGAGTGTLFAAGLLYALPAYLAVTGVLPLWSVAVLTFVLYVSWPMALAAQGLTGEILEIFNAVRILRGMVSAPIAYGAIVAISFALMTTLTIGVSVVAFMAGVAGGLTQPSPWLLALPAGAGFFALTYFHAATGYAMGRLVATHSRLGDVLSRTDSRRLLRSRRPRAGGPFR